LIIYLLAFSIKKSIFKNHFAKRGQFSLFASREGKKKNTENSRKEKVLSRLRFSTFASITLRVNAMFVAEYLGVFFTTDSSP
jgi:4'-phosphopantetheinyl transferase EntD